MAYINVNFTTEVDIDTDVYVDLEANVNQIASFALIEELEDRGYKVFHPEESLKRN